jgi:hypothetical protein
VEDEPWASAANFMGFVGIDGRDQALRVWQPSRARFAGDAVCACVVELHGGA